MANEQFPKIDTRVSLRFTHYRRRLLDPDNYDAKAVIDGLRAAAILENDTAEQVREVRHRAIQVKSPIPETTLIEIFADE